MTEIFQEMAGIAKMIRVSEGMEMNGEALPSFNPDEGGTYWEQNW